jgi:cytochrome c-type biogenesis protein CcmF
MSELGRFALLAAFAVTIFGIAATAVFLRRGDDAFRAAGERSVRCFAAFILLAAGALVVALVDRQFQVRFVAEVTSRDLPVLYTLAAFWGGHAGSLLLWALVLAGYGVAAQRSVQRSRELAPYVTIVILATGAFFSAALAFGSNPFTTVAVPPPDGRGLNPLLRNPWMAIHPPALYLGFVGMTVPYALTIGALATRAPAEQWVPLARRWVLAAWVFLTAGLLFGARWSYLVLGWGGYWAWDPVENAALMPWLTATAFLHTIQAQEHRGLFAGWTASLLVLSFGLAIFGTFLTRSGLLSSVHAFANASIGVYLLGFLAVAMTAGFTLLLWRLPEPHRGMRQMSAARRQALRPSGFRPAARSAAPDADTRQRAEAMTSREASSAPLESLLSREAALLANNVLLVLGAFVVLLGTIFPIFSEFVSGDRIAVGPPYFTSVLAPLVAVLLVLMAVGPLFPWQGGRADVLARVAAAPGAIAVLGGLAFAALGVRSAGVLFVLVLCVFVTASVVVEFSAGIRSRPVRRRGVVPALARLVAANRRRYGGYVVHFGFALVLAAATVSSSFSTVSQGIVAPGQALSVGGYDVRYDGARVTRAPGLRVITAALAVRRNARTVTTLRPSHITHEVRGETTADVAVRSTWTHDLYVVLVGMAPDGRATLRLSVNPMIMWLWLGVLVMLLGALIAAVPRRETERAASIDYARHPAAVAGGDR